MWLSPTAQSCLSQEPIHAEALDDHMNECTVERLVLARALGKLHTVSDFSSSDMMSVDLD